MQEKPFHDRGNRGNNAEIAVKLCRKFHFRIRKSSNKFHIEVRKPPSANFGKHFSKGV